MTSNRKAKTAARALAADSGRSYTHARRLEADQAAAEPAGFPRFPADAVLTVDAHNGAEQWTGARWNEYAETCERSGELFAVRLLRILERGNGQGTDSGPLAEDKHGRRLEGGRRVVDDGSARLCSGCRGDGIVQGDDPGDDGTECTVCDGTGLARPHGTDD